MLSICVIASGPIACGKSTAIRVIEDTLKEHFGSEILTNKTDCIGEVPTEMIHFKIGKSE